MMSRCVMLFILSVHLPRHRPCELLYLMTRRSDLGATQMLQQLPGGVTEHINHLQGSRHEGVSFGGELITSQTVSEVTGPSL